jgi:hypothetical protein
VRWLPIVGALLTLAGLILVEIGLWSLFLATSRWLRAGLLLLGTAFILSGLGLLWLHQRKKTSR